MNQSIKDAFRRFWEHVVAKIDSQKTVIVTVTEDANGNFTADKTYEELVEAINAGRDCMAHLKRYADNSNGMFLSLTKDLSGKYPYVEFAGVPSTYISNIIVTIDMSGSVGVFEATMEHIRADDGRLVEVDTSTVTVSSGEVLKLQYVKIGRLVHISMVVDRAECGGTLYIMLPPGAPHALYRYWDGLQTVPAQFVASNENKISTHATVVGVDPGEENDNETIIVVEIPQMGTYSVTEVWIDGSYISLE